jgi:predicted metalloprotease with PDZ domain
MRYLIVCVFFCLSVQTLFGLTIDYSLKMPKPQNHYFEVEMLLNKLSKKKPLRIKMPTWAPGSYMIREFSKNVNLVKAFDENGKKLLVNKVNKNTWDIVKGESKSVKIIYEVYSFELSVRTSFLDLSHGFVSGSSIFMYVDGNKDLAGKLDIYPYEDFNVITTALPKFSDSIRYENAKTYSFNNYDHLVDCPIEIGNQEVFEFNASGVKHTVAIYGVGNHSISKLQTDMKRIVEAATNVFGENPNKDYTFIIHNVGDGQGGLEHLNSTTLSVSRWAYEGKDYYDFLSLVAHEYFHLWNVKRIRPVELGPFNYDQENYTSLLWVMEGFTSYYDELLMRRAGYSSEKEYIQKINGVLNYVEGSEGSRVQPLAHASFDAWIKSYRPNENSANTTMTYYSRGQLIAAVLDAMIIDKFQGNKCLDHFMQTLYQKFYKNENRGFTEKEFIQTLSEFMGSDMNEFIEKYINDTQIPDYATIFSKIGVKVEYIGVKKPSFGISFSTNSTNPVVQTVRVNSEAEQAGISVNDEIIALNGFRMNAEVLDASLAAIPANQKFNLLISRDGIISEITAQLGEYERKAYRLTSEDSNPQVGLRNYWLRSLIK